MRVARWTHRVVGWSAVAAMVVIGLAVLTTAPFAHSQPDSAEVVAALRARNVYVAEAARGRLTPQEEADLERDAACQAENGIPTRLALLDRPPRPFTTLGQFVEAAHSALDLGDGLLIAVALDAGGGVGCVSAKSDALDDATLQRLQERNLGSFTAIGFAAGFRALADDAAREIAAQREAAAGRQRAIVLVIVLAVLGGVGFVLARRARAWRDQLTPVRELRDGLYPLLRRLDDDLPQCWLLGRDGPGQPGLRRGRRALRGGQPAPGPGQWHRRAARGAPCIPLACAAAGRA